MGNEYFYIYDYRQALFFIRNGAFLIDINVGSKNHIYHKFPRDKKTEAIFAEWKYRKYKEKTI